MLLSLVAVFVVFLFPSVPAVAVFPAALIEGFVLTPALVMLGIGRSVFGRLHYWYGAIICGEVALVYQSDGREFAPVNRESPDDEPVALLDDGTELPLDEESTVWYRLGNRPLAITWDKTDPDMVRRYCELRSMNLVASNDEIGILPEPRKGTLLWTPAPAVAARDQSVDGTVPVIADGAGSTGGDNAPEQAAMSDDGEREATAVDEEPAMGVDLTDIKDTSRSEAMTPDEILSGDHDEGRGPLLVNGPQLATALRGGGDTELSQQAERQGLRDHGGDTSLSQRMMIAAGTIALLGGAATGLVYLGWIA